MQNVTYSGYKIKRKIGGNYFWHIYNEHVPVIIYYCNSHELYFYMAKQILTDFHILDWHVMTYEVSE